MCKRLMLFPLLLSSALAQTPPSFEVASVKAAAPCCAPGQHLPSPKAGEDRIDFRYVTLRYCIEFAFGVEDYQLSGPPWLADARFDIEAKGPEGTRPTQLPDMLQNLLAERFGLRIHREAKDVSALALVITKGGPKLKQSVIGKDDTGPSFSMALSYDGAGRMEVKRASMSEFAKYLSVVCMHQPVIDLTGLDGRYDLDPDFSPEDGRGMAIVTVNGAPPVPDSAVSIYTSIKKFGLKLESRRLPLEVIVVDQIEKTPTEN
jgi:uncharacterized protein (TIGR03435 family)